MIASQINDIAVDDAGRAVEYRADYSGALAAGVEDYTPLRAGVSVEEYLARGMAPSFWAGSGARSARLSGPVDMEHAKRLFAALDPLTGEPLGEHRPKNGAMETSIAPHKSGSLFAELSEALGDHASARIIDEALDLAAVTFVDTCENLGAHRTRTHVGHGADRRMVWHHSDGFIVPVYAHETNHNGDPQRHRHLPFINRVCRGDGLWRSPDSRALYRAKGADVAVSGLRYNQHLVESGIVLDDDGAICGINPRLIAPFSSRHDKIKNAAAEWAIRFEALNGEQPAPNQLKDAESKLAGTTRRGGPDDPSYAGETRDERLARSLAKACDILGVTADSLDLSPSEDEINSQLERLEGWGWKPLGESSPQVQAALDKLLELTEQQAVWRRSQLLAAAAKQVPAGADHQWAHWLCDKALNRMVTLIEPQPEPSAPLYQTIDPSAATYQAPAVHAAERAVVAARVEGIGAGSMVAPKVAGWDEGLSEDQATAVEDICASGDTISVVVGRAGAGKTTMMRAAAARWAAARITVSGITVARRPGAILRDEAHLTHIRTVAQVRLGNTPPAGVWIVDEAAMVSTTDHAAIRAAAAASGSKLVLAGDPKQLPAIGAGGLLRYLAERHGASELTTIHRFHEEWEQANSKRLANGDHRSIDILDKNGRIHHAADWESIIEQARTHHTAALEAGHSFIAITATNTEAHALNLALRSQLDLGPELLRLQRTDLGPALEVPIAVGDIIATGRNTPHIVDTDGRPTNNGDRWRVTGADGRGGLAVQRLESTATAVLPAAYITGARHGQRPWVEHAIAVTDYRSQGVTEDYGVALTDDRTHCGALYVRTTRARVANHIIVQSDNHEQALEMLRGCLDRLPLDLIGIEQQELLLDATHAHAASASGTQADDTPATRVDTDDTPPARTLAATLHTHETHQAEQDHTAAQQRQETERAAQQRQETERAAQQRQETERAAQQRQETERAAQQRQETERAAQQRQETERAAQQRQETERAAQQRQETDTKPPRLPLPQVVLDNAERASAAALDARYARERAVEHLTGTRDDLEASADRLARLIELLNRLLDELLDAMQSLLTGDRGPDTLSVIQDRQKTLTATRSHYESATVDYQTRDNEFQAAKAQFIDASETDLAATARLAQIEIGLPDLPRTPLPDSTRLPPPPQLAHIDDAVETLDQRLDHFDRTYAPPDLPDYDHDIDVPGR